MSTTPVLTAVSSMMAFPLLSSRQRRDLTVAAAQSGRQSRVRSLALVLWMTTSDCVSSSTPPTLNVRSSGFQNDDFPLVVIPTTVGSHLSSRTVGQAIEREIHRLRFLDDNLGLRSALNATNTQPALSLKIRRTVIMPSNLYGSLTTPILATAASACRCGESSPTESRATPGLQPPLPEHQRQRAI